MQLILSKATDGLWDWNLRTGEDFHSSRYREMLGYGPDELPDTAAGFEAIVHPDDLPRVNAAQQTHLVQHAPYQVELRLRTKAGDYRWFVSRGQAEWDADGQPLRMAGFITDITERRRAEQTLRESNDRYDELVRRIPAGVYTLRLHAGTPRFEYISGKLLTLLGLKETDDWRDPEVVFAGVHPQDRPGFDAANQQAIEGLAPYRWEGRHQVRGETRWFRVASDPTRGADGDYRWDGVVTDITERKAMEAALIELNEQLERRVAERTAELQLMNERLDLAMEVTSDGVWDCNLQTEKVYCNANYFAMLGYGPDELGDDLADVMTNLLPPEEREAIIESIRQRFATEGGHESEFRMRTKDGGYRWVYARGRAMLLT
jgi:PAS domain S-box-containing protein